MPHILPFPRVVDSTMLAAYKLCATKFFWEYIRQIGPKAVSIHLHFGACYARGLEVFRTIYYSPRGGDLEHALGEALIAILLEWSTYPPDSAEPKTLYRCLAALDYYVREAHPPMADTLVPFIRADGTPAVEFTFAHELDVVHPITGEPLLYAGRFDMLGQEQGLLWVEDDKTTSALGPTWPHQWGLRSQFLGYTYIARTWGYPVEGAIARGLAILKTKYSHAESRNIYTNYLLNLWWDETNALAERMVHDWRRNKWALDLDTACTTYGGCPFTILCGSHEPDRWIDANFASRKWDPLSLDPLREARLHNTPLLQEIL